MIFKQTKNKKINWNKFETKTIYKIVRPTKTKFWFRKQICSRLPTSNFQLPTTSGFLLVEMIVSVALFSIVMTMGIGSLLSMIDVNRRAQSLKVVINNVNLAVESMSREIRTGYDYNCGSLAGGDCNSGDTSLYFTSSGGENIVYRFNNDSIEKSIDGSAFISIVASDITVTDLTFYVLGTDAGDDLQPRTAMVVNAHTGTITSESVDFGLYTTISQRKLDS